jgi:hypothetical protein
MSEPDRSYSLRNDRIKALDIDMATRYVTGARMLATGIRQTGNGCPAVRLRMAGVFYAPSGRAAVHPE